MTTSDADLHYDYDSLRRLPRAAEELAEIVRQPGLLRALVERNLKVRYRRSVLGIAWTMLNPAAMMIVLSLAFSRVFAAQLPHYPAYVFSGLIMWNFFSQTVLAIVGEVAAGIDLWRRVRLPKTALAVATAATGLLNLLFALVPLFIVLFITRQPLGMSLVSMPVTLIACSMFVLGFALAASAIALRFPDVADLLGVGMMAWMFATPIIYPRSVASPIMARWLRLNPMTLYIEAFRDPLYRNAMPSARTLLLALAIGAVALLLGWIVFTRSAHDAARSS